MGGKQARTERELVHVERIDNGIRHDGACRAGYGCAPWREWRQFRIGSHCGRRLKGKEELKGRRNERVEEERAREEIKRFSL